MRGLQIAVIMVLSLTWVDPTMAAGKKIRIPKRPVLEDYELPKSLEEQGDAVRDSAASGDGTSLTKADLARLGVISSSYTETVSSLERILQAIQLRSPVPDLKARVEIINDSRPSAWAVDRGRIVVSNSLLSAINEVYSEPRDRIQAIAYLMAHEFSHLLYDHPYLFPRKEKGVQVGKIFVGAYTMLGMVNSVGGGTEELRDAQEVMRAAVIASPWIESELYRAVYVPYKRKEEQKADFLAVDLLLDPGAGEAFVNVKEGAAPIRSIYKKYDDSAKAEMKKLAKDTEKVMQRAALDIIRMAPRSGVNGEDMGRYLEDRLKAAGIELLLRGLSRRRKEKPHLYYSSDKRVDAIDTYTDRFYDEQVILLDQVNVSELDYSRGFEKENSATSIARQAMKFLSSGDVEGAQKALASYKEIFRFKNIAYLEATVAVAYAKRNFEEAISKGLIAIGRDEASTSAFHFLSLAYAALGQIDEAVEVLDLGILRFSLRDFIVYKIDLLYSVGRSDEVQVLLQECRALDDSDLFKQCQTNAGIEPQDELGPLKDILKGPLGNL